MLKIKELLWFDRTEEYDGLETYKACNALGWYAIFSEPYERYNDVYEKVHDKLYVLVHAKDEGDLFASKAIVINTSPTLEEAKIAAQKYHDNEVLSLLSLK